MNKISTNHSRAAGPMWGLFLLVAVSLQGACSFQSPEIPPRMFSRCGGTNGACSNGLLCTKVQTTSGPMDLCCKTEGCTNETDKLPSGIGVLEATGGVKAVAGRRRRCGRRSGRSWRHTDQHGCRTQSIRFSWGRSDRTQCGAGRAHGHGYGPAGWAPAGRCADRCTSRLFRCVQGGHQTLRDHHWGSAMCGGPGLRRLGR